MKTIHLYLLFIVSLFACNNTIQRSNALAQKPTPFTVQEQQDCISALSLYLQVDSNFAKDAKKYADKLSKEKSLSNEGTQEYYDRNIIHIDSVIKASIILVKQNKSSELLTLLKKEKNNIYAHPSNTLDNQMRLTDTFFILYKKCKLNKEEICTKMSALYEDAYLHMQMLEALNGEYYPDHYDLLSTLIVLYESTKMYPKAIAKAKDMCEFIATIEPEGKKSKSYATALQNLGDLYKESGDKVRADSCSHFRTSSSAL